MSGETSMQWTVEAAAAYAALSGLSPAPDQTELARLCTMGDRVATAGRSVARMPSKTDEPASVFQVPR